MMFEKIMLNVSKIWWKTQTYKFKELKKSSRIYIKEATFRYYVLNLPRVKEKEEFLKAVKEK